MSLVTVVGGSRQPRRCSAMASVWGHDVNVAPAPGRHKILDLFIGDSGVGAHGCRLFADG